MRVPPRGRVKHPANSKSKRVGRRRPIERYSFGLLIRHPTIRPDAITSVLGLAPKHSWQQGESRRTLDGMELGGTQPDTMWRSMTVKKRNRRFFGGVRELVGMLRPHRDFLAALVSEGGRVTLIVHLPGDVNMGDVLEPHDLQLISELRLTLGVEVFPEWDG